MAVTENEIFRHGVEAARILWPFVLFPFSLGARNQIKDRAREKGNGELVDEITGSPAPNGEAAHLNHSRAAEDYDDPENGLWVNKETHAWMHQIDEDNGLTPVQNSWAIGAILRRLNGNGKK